MAELAILLAIVGLLSTVLLISMRGDDTQAKAAKLKVDLRVLREALEAYHADHGFYPCSEADWNRRGDVRYFRRQLTWYTDAQGQVSRIRSDRYCFGPYLERFPENPFWRGKDEARATDVVIDLVHDRTLPELQRAVARGNGDHGWYYEARSGNVVPNLGSDAFPDEYCFF